MLNEVLTQQRMQRVEKVASWEEAIRLASQPLLEEQVIEERYVAAMIESVEVNGPYIVLQDYFALPHASAGNGVNELGMALLVLDEPVDLKGNPVKIFLVLAAIDSSAHLQALAEISELLINEENYKVFLSGDLDKIIEMIK